MSDELLEYYKQELTFLRQLGTEFATAHPKIAGRLRLGPDMADDPHVERFIEAAAYLNARTRFKLEDDFPEISDALLSVLYPHYLSPVPSMAVVQFTLDRGQGDLVAGYTVPRHSALETDPIDGEPCRFRTAYPVTLWPIELTDASLTGRPFAAPVTPSSPRAVAVLRLQLQCFSKEVRFAQLVMPTLRLFLKGQAQHVYALYELMLNNVLGVALANSPTDREPALLGPECLRPVGFEQDEGMLPYAARSFPGYRLLTEYFAFPQKYLFIDLGGLQGPALRKVGNHLEIYFYLNKTVPELEQIVAGTTFQLGCTPIANLYRQRAEPIILTHRDTEYRVVPDVRRPLAHEVYSVDRVVATSPDNEQLEFRPFYSFKHSHDAQGQKAFYFARREAASAGNAQHDRGSEVFLSLVDLGFRPSAPADWTLDVETTCLNRDLPYRLPLGEGHSGFQLLQGAPITRIECVSGRPTPTLRPALRHGALWRLVSHLSLNHLSLADSEEGAEALREILKLYDFAASPETRSMIEGLLGVACRRVVGRSSGSGSGFVRGLEVTVRLDPARFTGSGVFLFATVLERFLGLYATINSFSQLVATLDKREGVLKKWPPRAGDLVLL
jgi:type VI secretion system protein ImpG